MENTTAMQKISSSFQFDSDNQLIITGTKSIKFYDDSF